MKNRRNRTTGLIRWAESLEPRCLLAVPVLDAIADATFPAGKSLILPLTASDADGDALTYSFSSDNPAVNVQMHSGNPFLRLSVANFGNIDIELLHDVAPNTADTIAALARNGFYNNLIFHRVIPNFMIQGGDPTGTGSGGPGFQFDDEFNSSAIFSGSGQLAMANSGDDTNGSQIFITDGPQRHLDFNHTIFGQVVRGMDVVRAIANTPRNASDRPLTPVVITSATIIQDTSDAVVTLSGAAAGTANITVTVDDGHGGTSSQNLHVTVDGSDATDDNAFFGPVQNQSTAVNTPLTLNLSGTDIDAGTLSIDAIVLDQPAHATLQKNGGTITVTPEQNYTGVIHMLAGVRRASDGQWDTQRFSIAVGGQATGAYINSTAGRIINVGAATFTDPAHQASDFQSAVIDWGDGHHSNGAITRLADGTFLVSGSNLYVNPGVYQVQTTVTNPDGTMFTLFSSATVGPDGGAAQFSAGPAVSINEGGSFTRTVTYPNAGAMTATVDYGDGTGAQVVDFTGGRLVLNHTYGDSGQYAVTIQVNDGATQRASGSLAVGVTNLAPTVSVSGGSGGLRGTAQTVSFSGSDVSPADVASGFMYVIDWGDGSAAQTMPAGSTSASHVFALPGVYSVQVMAVDKDGASSAPQVHTMAISAAQVEADPGNVRKTALVIAGTAGADRINLVAGAKGVVKATLNGISLGAFKPTGRIIIYGGDGNDTIIVDPRIKLTAELHGEGGNDVLSGGGGNDILVGGDGSDNLKGNGGLDVLIGGVGKDKLYGGVGEDILIADSTAYDGNSSGLAAVLAEWTRPKSSYAVRVGHLLGKGRGLNGAFRLKGLALQADGFADVLTSDDGNDALWLNIKTGIRDKVAGRTTAETMTDM